MSIVLGSAFGCDSLDFQCREEWLNARRNSVGASDSAALFGVGYDGQSAITVWHEKVNEVEPEKEVQKRFKIGKLIEPALRSIFTEETGWECNDPGEFRIFRHPTHSFISATLDGICDHPEHGLCPVELKNVSNFQKSEWEGDPPLKFQIQVQQQLAVTGARVGFLLGLIGGNDPHVICIERNDRFIDQVLIPTLTDFWASVIDRVPPPFDPSKVSGRDLCLLWPEDDLGCVPLPPEAESWREELDGLKEAIKDATNQKEAIENQIKTAIGGNTFGLMPNGGRFSWKTQERKGYWVEPTSFRVLRFSNK